ncbi:DUF1254 domain-containing protein [Curtobacterium sp. 18060]|uniref:DUF1254 domain-containing protein n=1 Tax=Curtobacterium sp. 18060 TaxID=2681408 RepID=UPI001F2F7E3B|nr:DUF1254 domain-containing protein [Curtobacterium sp. 18060]
MAQIDLSVGPVRLRVPDTAGRYYVLQFVSAWTDNFAYVGHRATGTHAAEFVLVPPTWDDSAPSGTTVIHFPTTVASIVGRWAVSSDDDLPAVHALQDATTLTPLPVRSASPNRTQPFPRTWSSSSSSASGPSSSRPRHATANCSGRWLPPAPPRRPARTSTCPPPRTRGSPPVSTPDERRSSTRSPRVRARR